MQFLKILFWCLLAFIAAVFTLGNWTWVPIRLWGGLIAETNLPFLLLLAYLAGLVPTAAYQHWMRWRLRQRLQSAERQLTTLRAMAPLEPRPAPPVAPIQPVAPAPVPPPPPAPPPIAGDGPDDATILPGQLS